MTTIGDLFPEWQEELPDDEPVKKAPISRNAHYTGDHFKDCPEHLLCKGCGSFWICSAPPEHHPIDHHIARNGEWRSDDDKHFCAIWTKTVATSTAAVATR